jgi:hypothetical protein
MEQIMAITKIERDFRQFLRANFRARLALHDGAANTPVRGKTARAEIKNVNTVLAELAENAKLVRETAHTHTFDYKSGKVRAEITLTDSGNLTMVNKS